MKLTRTITALLLAGLLLPTLAACGGDTSAGGGTVTTALPTTTTDVQQTTTAITPTETIPDVSPEVLPLEEINFVNEGLAEDDLTINVAYVERTVGEYVRRSLKADPEDDSTVDLKTLERDERLKAQMGLELNVELVSSSIADMEGAIETQLMAGAGEYDLLAGYQYFALEMATKGYLFNLDRLNEENANYINFDAIYWAKEYNNQINPKDAHFWITGDLALNYIGGMYATFVNTQLYRQYLEKEYGSIYQIAREGEWNADLMLEMVTDFYAATASNLSDTYGFGYEKNDPIDALAMGMGAQLVYIDPDSGEVNLTVNNSFNFDISQMIRSLTLDSNGSFDYPDTDSWEVMIAFATGKLLFTVNKIYQVEVYLAEMNDYALIPVPKYAVGQDDYRTLVHEGCTLFGIPYDTSKIRQTAAALEFLCAYSYRDVTPQYYFEVSRKQYVYDSGFAEMIDLIYSSATTDFGYAWNHSLNNLGYIYRSCQELNPDNIKRKVRDWAEDLTDVVSRLERIK